MRKKTLGLFAAAALPRGVEGRTFRRGREIYTKRSDKISERMGFYAFDMQHLLPGQKDEALARWREAFQIFRKKNFGQIRRSVAIFCVFCHINQTSIFFVFCLQHLFSMMFGKLVAIFDVTPKFRIRNTNFPDRCVKNNTDANLEGFRERSPTFCCRPSFLDQARPKTPGLRKGVRVRYAP